MERNSLTPFDMISPLDARYYGNDPKFYAAVHPYLSEEATLRYQLKAEQALIAQLEASGVAPRGVSELVARAATEITPAEIYRVEEETHHNIRAIVECIRARLPDRARGYVHLFATSNDIMDTARSLALRDVVRDVVLPDLIGLARELIRLSRANAETPQIGRTHGRHAVPITLGYWLANYVARLGQRIELVAQTASNLRGKFSGAVGAHNASALRFPEDPAFFEVLVLARLGLRPTECSISTQIVHPEYLTDFAHCLVSTLSVCANLADDCRHLMRSEIEEIRDTPDRHRVGSSTMPHKTNPKDFENIKSLWKAFMPRMFTVYMDQISEHQRDLTNSASGRFINELVAGVDYAARRLLKAIQETRFDRAAIERNFARGSEWAAAEPLYIALALSGHPDPYQASQALVAKARDSETGLLTLLRSDPEALRLLEQLRPEYREVVTNPSKYLGDAVARTEIACETWERRLDPTKLATDLQRPAEDVALSGAGIPDSGV